MQTKPKLNLAAVIACLIVMFSVGLVYMWSVFQQPVTNHYGWDASAVSMISSAMIMMFVFGIFIGGTLQDKFGPRLVVTIGGILFSAGLFLSSMIPASLPWLMYVTYGVLGGSGVGLAYSGSLNCVQRWLPHKRGFAAGICVCAFGLSVVVFSPVVEYMHRTLGENAVPNTFRVLGILFFVIITAASFFVKERRIIRAIEFYKMTGIPISVHQEETKKKISRYSPCMMAIKWDMEELYKRTDKRVDIMLESGLIDEVKGLIVRGYNKDMVSMQGIGYKEIIEYLNGEISLCEAIEKIKLGTRHYAKRQMTWFRRDERINWIDYKDDILKRATEILEEYNF